MCHRRVCGGLGQIVQCPSCRSATTSRLKEQQPSPTGLVLSRLRIIALLPFAGLLSGCNTVVLSPSGDVAVQQRDALIESTVLMLLIIIPVIALTVFFAWRYRHSNAAARYEPDWDHSTQLELVIWSVPLLIIICLGAVAWASTHLLDPYRPLDRVAAGPPTAREDRPPNGGGGARGWVWAFSS